MSNKPYPNNNCGECPGWLALGEEGGAPNIDKLIDTMCYKCPLYTNQRYGDSTCVVCGRYTNDGQFCHTCWLNITNGGKL